MTSWATWLTLWLALPAATAAFGSAMRSPTAALNAACGGLLAAVAGGVGMLAAWWASPGHCLETAGGWFRMDALSAFHLAILLAVHGLSTIYARVYFGVEARAGHLSMRSARTFAALWPLSFATMALVLLSNNLGVMWVSIEATTLVTAFLICVHSSRESIEAMWKYIVICSVGVALAFVGEVLVASAGRAAGLSDDGMLLVTDLTRASATLNPVVLKVAFLLVVVGYGTKAGLAPMHNWLPDAHSQAPAPVSALFSGFMLNAALYCVIRHVPIVNGATGGVGWPNGILTVIGLFSIVVAAAFILFQKDIKRFLAYSSVEHMGVIALGFGLGGVGTFAALFHTLNHSVAKSLSFFAAGRLGQHFGTHEMSRMGGAIRAMRVWGLAVLIGILTLIGVAPFAVFMSELQILMAAVGAGAKAALIVFLVGVGIVFVGALGHVIAVVWGGPAESVAPRPSWAEWGLLAGMGGVLLMFGLWLPAPLADVLKQAAAVVQAVPAASVVLIR